MKITASIAEDDARLEPEDQKYCLLVVNVTPTGLSGSADLQLKLPSHHYHHLKRMGINPYDFFLQIANKLNS